MAGARAAVLLDQLLAAAKVRQRREQPEVIERRGLRIHRAGFVAKAGSDDAHGVRELRLLRIGPYVYTEVVFMVRGRLDRPPLAPRWAARRLRHLENISCQV